jgi:hypothetical protein
MKLTLPKVGSWSPLRLLKIQSSIAGVKTPRIGVFLMSLKRSWSLGVQNGLAWAIWTYAAQVIGKRKAGSRTGLGNVIRDNFGTPFWESQEKVSFGCSLGGELQRILYGGRWWLPPSLGRGESSESELPVACPNTKGVPECELTLLWLVLDVESCNKIIIPLPSIILELLARPSHPL